MASSLTMPVKVNQKPVSGSLIDPYRASQASDLGLSISPRVSLSILRLIRCVLLETRFSF